MTDVITPLEAPAYTVARDGRLVLVVFWGKVAWFALTPENPHEPRPIDAPPLEEDPEEATRAQREFLELQPGQQIASPAALEAIDRATDLLL